MSSDRRGDVTRLLSEVTDGNHASASVLMPLVYDELRRLAASALMRERKGHTLQPTALVHEAFLRLVDQRNVAWESRAHFLAIASQAMRRILVDHARRRHAVKRGSGQTVIALEELASEPAKSVADLLALDIALDRLTAKDTRMARIVELRFFGGLSVDESATVLQTSARTVKRDWQVARAWLRREMASSRSLNENP